jgi:hypothetical protein
MYASPAAIIEWLQVAQAPIDGLFSDISEIPQSRLRTFPEARSYDGPTPFHGVTEMRRALGMSSVLLLSTSVSLAQTNPCPRPENQQFEFWAGTWTGTWQDQEGKSFTGTNRIEWVLGGCVLQENFEDPTGGLVGKSWSVYDPNQKKWKQTWVDNQGSYQDLAGERQDGKMILEREALIQGQTRRQRMTFYNIAADSFDWDWEISSDGGATWKLGWRIHYTRKK